MKLASYGITDIGLVRLKNEDEFLEMPIHRCFLLADGMGGHRAGEVAARETLSAIRARIEETSVQPSSKWKRTLEEIIQGANKRVYEMAIDDPEKEGMGTTLCLALFADNSIIHAHVGDSRIYRLRKQRLTQLTQDHSLRGQLIASGELDEKDAASYPRKNVITRAIGIVPRVRPDITRRDVESDDLYLLCTDGLTDTLSNSDIQEILASSTSLEETANDLVDEAKKKGSRDNITLILIRAK